MPAENEEGDQRFNQRSFLTCVLTPMICAFFISCFKAKGELCSMRGTFSGGTEEETVSV
jgi:hypothetical protein